MVQAKSVNYIFLMKKDGRVPVNQTGQSLFTLI